MTIGEDKTILKKFIWRIVYFSHTTLMCGWTKPHLTVYIDIKFHQYASKYTFKSQANDITISGLVKFFNNAVAV